MKSLKGFFLGAVAEAVRETAWFQSAPVACQASATFKILGVESREFRSVIGARQIRPALLEASHGGRATPPVEEGIA